MADNQNTRPVYPKSILDNRSMRLSVEAADQGKWATFSVDVNDEAQVVFKVWPQDSDDATRNRGPIEAKWDSLRFNNVLGLIRIAMKMSQEGKTWQDKVEYSDRPWIRGDGGRSERAKDPKPMWATWVGADEAGKIWISIQVYKRPNIQFFFGKDVFNNLYHKSGDPYTDAEISRAFASGWIDSLVQHVPPLLAGRYNHEKTLPKKKEDGGGNQRQGGNYNQSSGGGNGGGKSPNNDYSGSHQNQRSNESAPAKSDNYSDVEDDDMPF